MNPIRSENLQITIAAEKPSHELIEQYHELREELKVARNIFEFERATDIQAEMDIILNELGKRRKRKIS